MCFVHSLVYFFTLLSFTTALPSYWFVFSVIWLRTRLRNRKAAVTLVLEDQLIFTSFHSWRWILWIGYVFLIWMGIVLEVFLNEGEFLKNESIGGFWLSSFGLDRVEVMHLKVFFYLQHFHNDLIQSVHVVLIKLSIFALLFSIILKWFVCLRKGILGSPVRFVIKIRRVDNKGIRRNVLVSNWLVLIIIITEASHERARPVGFNAIDERTVLDQGAGVVFADFDVRLWLFVFNTVARTWLLLMLMDITAIWLSHHIARLWSEHFIVVFRLGCWLLGWDLLLALFIVIFLAILIWLIIFFILKLN